MSMDSITFDDLFPEDCQQYETVSAEYISLASEDYETAYELTKKCWFLAQRWAEISANAGKLASMHRISKSGIHEWAYLKYRLMILAHEHCRMIWKQGKDDSRTAV
jgi:hypothetical protein